MRSGEAIVGGITAGYEGFGNRIARLMMMDQVVCYNVDVLIICAAVKYLHDNAERSGLSLNFEQETTR